MLTLNICAHHLIRVTYLHLLLFLFTWFCMTKCIVDYWSMCFSLFRQSTVNIVDINMEAGLEAAVCWVNIYIMQHSNSFTSHLSCKYQQKLKHSDSLHGCSSLSGLPPSLEIHQTNWTLWWPSPSFMYFTIYSRCHGVNSSRSHTVVIFHQLSLRGRICRRKCKYASN